MANMIKILTRILQNVNKIDYKQKYRRLSIFPHILLGFFYSQKSHQQGTRVAKIGHLATTTFIKGNPFGQRGLSSWCNVKKKTSLLCRCKCWVAYESRKSEGGEPNSKLEKAKTDFSWFQNFPNVSLSQQLWECNWRILRVMNQTLDLG